MSRLKSIWIQKKVFSKNMLSLLYLSYSVSTLTITYYVIRMGWFFSVLPVSVDDSGADSFVICSSVVCRGSSCAGWRCSGLKFFWLWSFLTMQGKLFRLHFVCNNCCRRKSYMQVHFYPKAFFSFPFNDLLQFTNLWKLLILCILISVRSWNFKDGGSLKASFLA